MHAFIAAAIKHARTVISLLILLMVMGIKSYFSIPKESTPDVKVPLIYTSIHHEGISPQDAERLLVRPIEQKLRSVEGAKEMRSAAYQDGAHIIVEFNAGFDSHKARIDVQSKVDEAKAELPHDTDEPAVMEINLSLFPVLVINLSGALPKRALYKIAKDLQDEVEASIPSVLEAKVRGGQEDTLDIVIDPVKIENYGLGIADLEQFVSQNNQLISAGNIDTGKGRLTLKITGLIETAFDLEDFVVKSTPQGVVRLKDIAEILPTFKDRTGYARERGEDAVALEVVKRTGENIIDTVAKVQEVVREQQKKWPPHLKVSYSGDESERIQDMLTELENSLIIAVLLVMLVIIQALGWRSALLVGLAVPGSFLMGILVLDMMHVTLNIVVLFSLILAVGMLVDGAIIVVEFADVQMAAGKTARLAYRSAAQRMAWPVITSITTILVVFIPLLFWPGFVGQFMKFLPLTLIATLTASLLMALIFVPTIGSLTKAPRAHMPISDDVDKQLGDFTGYTRTYIAILEKALTIPGKVLGGAVTLLVLVIIGYKMFGHGVEFFPDIDPDMLQVKVRARGDLSVEEKNTIVKEVENRLLDMEEFRSIYTNTDLGRGSSDLSEDTIGVITLEFKNWELRRPAKVIMADLDKRLENSPGIIIELQKDKAGPPTTKPIEVELTSSNIPALQAATQKVKTFFNQLPGLQSIEDTRSVPGIDWQVSVDRYEAARYETSIAQVGKLLRLLSNGFKVTDFQPDNSREKVDILVRFPPEQRTLWQLDALRTQTPFGSVPLNHFVTVTPHPKLTQIHRADGHRILTVLADVRPGTLVDDKVNEIRDWLTNNAKLPDGVKWKFKGEESDKAETGQFLANAFLIALAGIAIILVTQFNSFFSMGLILSSVIMSTIGVFIGLMITGQAFGIVMGGIGIISLSGIIVSNNIILLDTFDYLNARLKNKRHAILLTGAQRLRPVILTKLTTILGLLPIFLGLNVDIINLKITYGAPSNAWWYQLATAIIFGVLFASTLTLIVTPCALMLRENYRQWRQKNAPRVMIGKLINDIFKVIAYTK